MCGITGLFAFSDKLTEIKETVLKSVKELDKRGPDVQDVFMSANTCLGHSRLSIIDPGPQSNQPFLSDDRNIAVVFNGEFYNHKSFRKDLRIEGYDFKTDSDAEVILHLYRKCGNDLVKYINGCFALAIWDNRKNQLFIARDRYGIKPLYYYHDDNFFAFASEMKALLEYPIPREIDSASLFSYFQFNYIPDNKSMLRNVYSLKPGSHVTITSDGINHETFYDIPDESNSELKQFTYEEAKLELIKRLRQSVSKRMLSDVPLGAFLSGGIDSSAIVALASEETNNLNTFSLGFKDEAFFDETSHAEEVAKKFNTNHKTFTVSKDDMLNEIDNILDYIDEPFADSSAIAVYMLSKKTSGSVRAALSGDGADELFGGYNKHLAHLKAYESNYRNKLISNFSFLWKNLPQSRQNNLSNKFRQLNRFADGLKLSPEERYWRWASLQNENNTKRLLKAEINMDEYNQRKENILYYIRNNPTQLQNILYTDMKMVLTNDMLMKVDLMSMGNSLEVRTPFLDHNVVNFAFNIPFSYKVSDNDKKKILKDSFSDILPEKILNRPKHGFEVPLLSWFRNELSEKIDTEIFNKNFIKEQGIFDEQTLMSLRKKMHSKNPGDSPALVWSLLVFQNWWKKTIN